MFEGPEVRAVITMRRARGIPSSRQFAYHSFRLAHKNCGGMTDGEWQVHLYLRIGAWDLASPTDLPSRDMLCIVNAKLHGMPCQAPPQISAGSVAKVREVRPGLYRVDGLCPWGRDRLQVVAPCVFSVTKWVRRHLSGTELCLVKDVSEELQAGLVSKDIASLCKDQGLLPLKICTRLLSLMTIKVETSSQVAVGALNNPESSNEGPVVGSLDGSFGGCADGVFSGSSGGTASGNPEGAPKRFKCSTEKGEAEDGQQDAQEDRERRNQKSARGDNADIPTYLWDSVLNPEEDPSKKAALDKIRFGVLRWIKRRICREFLSCFFGKHRSLEMTWKELKCGDSPREGVTHMQVFMARLKRNVEARKDWEAGRECIGRYSNSSWWEWTDGSRPHFWRWPEEYQKQIRDGVSPWFRSKVPSWWVPQRVEKDQDTWKAMRAKLEKVKTLRYIQPGTVTSLTFYFSVPKGETDIRMVYDGTKSGLNDSMWAPWFALPTVETHLRFVGPETWLGDIDIGDMFHNFMLHEKVQKLAGIDVTPFFPEELARKRSLKAVWLRWVRSAMGLKNSPYNCIQGVLIAEEVIRGNPHDDQNVFKWDYIALNLPGSPSYQPGIPWIGKRRRSDGLIACDFLIYVDDIRSGGNGRSEARRVSRVIAMKLNYLGLQDAARKRRDPSQQPGPWAGSVVGIEDGMVYVTVTQERWDKAKMMVKWICKAVEGSEEVDYKTLESYRGFLIYFSRTYPACVPYLKGVHLTLDSWRPWRKEDGWKYSLREIRAMLEERGADVGETIPGSGDKPPGKVKVAPRLHDDL